MSLKVPGESSVTTPRRQTGRSTKLGEVNITQTIQEDEVKMADMEGRLRAMVLEVVRPTVVRSAKLQTEFEKLSAASDKQGQTLRRILLDLEDVKDASELVKMFKPQMLEFTDASQKIEQRICDFQRETIHRIEKAEQNCELQKAHCSRLSRNLDRAVQDMETFNGDIEMMRKHMLDDIKLNKEHMDQEIKRVDQYIRDVDDMRHRLADEVWGEEVPTDASPPSFRRLDMQMRRSQTQMAKAEQDIAELRKLEAQMDQVNEHRAALDAQQKVQEKISDDLRNRVDKIGLDVKQDSKLVANMMAAFTANLMQDIRGNFNVEVQQVREMHHEIDSFVHRTEQSINTLNDTCRATTKQVEASLYEMRIDIESLDSKRKCDKQGVQEMINKLEGSVGTVSESSQATLRGLEHVSNVISLSLQSERMSVALDVQDFVERKDTPYVGVRSMECTKIGKCASRPFKGAGLDPDLLIRLVYQPQPVSFQGTCVERPQLLALREKLVHAAQEVLLKGPGPGGKGGLQRKLLFSNVGTPDSQVAGQNIAPPVVPHALGTSADMSSAMALYSANRTQRIPISRPGSRGQPSARGSPGLEGFSESQVGGGAHACTWPRRASSRAAAATAAWESPGSDNNGKLIESTGENSGNPSNLGSGTPHLPSLADSAAGRARPALATDHCLPLTVAPASALAAAALMAH